MHQKTSFGQLGNDERVHFALRKDWEVKVEVELPALIEEGNLTGKNAVKEKSKKWNKPL